MKDLINAADNADKSKGERKWSRQCKLHQEQEIKELEQKKCQYCDKVPTECMCLNLID